MDITIIDAFFRTDTGNEIPDIITDFKRRVCGESQTNLNPRPKVEPKQRKARSLFNDEKKAEIVRRYKAGEGPKAISESLGCSRSMITHIIRDAGAVEGRIGAHLNKKQAEALPEAERKEPV